MITIKVTENMIRAGKRYSCTDCPVALGIKKSIDLSNYNLSVIENEIRIRDSNWTKLQITILPPIAKKFIYDFDNVDHVFPFEFEIHDETKLFPLKS